jgi:SpoIID/LytB domain protein
VIFIVLQAFSCTKTEVTLTRPQKVFLHHQKKDYPVRIGLTVPNNIVEFSAGSDFKLINPTNDSLIYSGEANEPMVCIFPVSPAVETETDVWRIQIAAFKSQESVDRFIESLAGIPTESAYVFFDGEWFKVRLGNFTTREQALKLKSELPPEFGDSFPVKVPIIPDDIGSIEIVNSDKTFSQFFREPIAVIPSDSDAFVELNERLYRGSLEVGITQYGRNYAVNVVTLDDYLKGVLPAEMNPNWEMEALKAQAVAARTQTITRLESHKNDGFDLCDREHCQVYKGVSVERERTNDAVDETDGEILIYNGRIIEAVYSANCGGHTENARDVWGSDNYDYLTGVRDFATLDRIPHSGNDWEKWIQEPPKAFCKNHDSERRETFRWKVVRTREELEDRINQDVNLGHIRDIIPRQRGRSGRLTHITIVGTEQTIQVTKELKIRQILGNLKSSCFVVFPQRTNGELPESFTFFGAGYGHGVGMCQTGAAGMADLGYSYKEILAHYYRGAQIIDLGGIAK